MSVKKRLLAALCAAALCLALALPAGGATGNPCFIAVNDSLLRLEDRYIPILVDGLYYVPYTALDSSVTGVDLGIFAFYNSTVNMLTIYNKEQLLIFDLSADTCTDRDGTSYTVRAINRNGRIYVPIRFVCVYFDLSYSSRMTTYGQLVRVRSSSARLDDNSFIAQAQMGMMESRLQEWRRNQQTETETPAVTPTPTPSPSPTPSAPAAAQTPAVTVTPEPAAVEEPVDKSDVSVYIAVQADALQGLDALLTTLEQNQVQALFFFPAQELADQDDQVRQILCAGHAVGLLLTADTGEEALAEVARGQKTLGQIAHIEVGIVLAPDLDSEGEEALTQVGLLCWHTDVDALPDGSTARRQASTVLNQTDRYTRQVFLLSDASPEGASLLAQLLPQLREDQYDLRLAVETVF
jgi:hypothetical protein